MLIYLNLFRVFQSKNLNPYHKTHKILLFTSQLNLSQCPNVTLRFQVQGFQPFFLFACSFLRFDLSKKRFV